MNTSFRLSILAAGLLAVSFASAESVFGVTTGGRLVSFDSATPGTYATNVALSGLTGTDKLVGLDFRPANGTLVALAQSGRLYTINTTSGAASLLSTLSVAIPATGSFGADFNPTVDRLRVVNTSRDNLRVNVDSGATLVDGTLTYAAGDAYAVENPSIAAVAYTNSVPGATTTSIYYIDASLDNLATSAAPNGGILNTVGALGFNATNLTDFDISGLTGTAFASVNVPGQMTSSLYRVNLGTGAGTLVGNFTSGDRIALIAITPVPEPASIAALGLGMVGLLGRRRRNK